MSPRNMQDMSGYATQLTWLEAQLSESVHRNYIIQSHIPPGVQYVEELVLLWTDEAQEQYTALFHRFQSKILFYTASHIHTADIRAP